MLDTPISNPSLFSYIITADTGFAPNPFEGICTLACCKPQIRRTASISDWVIGTSPAPKPGRVVYAMQVNRALPYDLYFADPRYAAKKPSETNPRGDNIYRKDSSGRLEQIPNASHDARHVKPDLSGKRVLIADRFYYFGRKAPEIPKEFSPLVHTTQGHRRIRPGHADYGRVQEFLLWLSQNQELGVRGEPTEDRLVCRLPEEDGSDD